MCIANFIPPGNGACLGIYFKAKNLKFKAKYLKKQADKNNPGSQNCKQIYIIVGSALLRD